MNYGHNEKNTSNKFSPVKIEWQVKVKKDHSKCNVAFKFVHVSNFED